MKEGPDIARVAALIGDPARANMLTALMAGKALTATELAGVAGITPQTATSHLARLVDGGLAITRKQGRHKYLALADDQIAGTLESLMGLAARIGHSRTRTGPKDAAMREALVCYNHLAGAMGTRMFDSMVGHGLLEQSGEALRLTDAGARAAAALGIDVAALSRGRAPVCRSCLDWSERRTHLAGSLGRALLARFEAEGWARRDPASRAVRFSPDGRRRFDALFPA
ncbi:ArsR/SmtB family transcription factor [Paracoccus marinus]|uniref:ArsR/SmtB family transcription factor n=1 Tax=Paracoccus marinus TaxID=288426 RepID=UPI00117D6EFF|nr:winged helix-turn-helix domain-containing protein [Paracoccus marinus]